MSAPPPIPVPPPPARLEEVACPACSAREYRVLGIRGNREHFGADPNAEPHIATRVVRCRACDLIYTNPMIRGLDHLETDYYNDPQTYRATAGEDYSAMFHKRLELIAKHRAPGTLLDVGAGKGEFLTVARAAGWAIAGIEPSEGFRRHARERFGLEISPGPVGGGGPAPGGPFDAVTLNHVLEHVENPRAFLDLIRGELKAEGVLFIEVPNADSPLLRLADLYFRLQGKPWSTRLSPLHPPFHRIGFTKVSLARILGECGFKVLSLTTFPGSDRGYRPAPGGIRTAVVLRALASGLFSFAGAGELLAAVASPLE